MANFFAHERLSPLTDSFYDTFAAGEATTDKFQRGITFKTGLLPRVFSARENAEKNYLSLRIREHVLCSSRSTVWKGIETTRERERDNSNPTTTTTKKQEGKKKWSKREAAGAASSTSESVRAWRKSKEASRVDARGTAWNTSEPRT